MFDIRIDGKLNQRQQVLLGQFLGRAITADWLVSLADAGYRGDLIDAALVSLRSELQGLRSSFSHCDPGMIFNDFSEKRSWLEVLQPEPELA